MFTKLVADFIMFLIMWILLIIWGCFVYGFEDWKIHIKAGLMTTGILSVLYYIGQAVISGVLIFYD
jgi:hypothetical protein